MSGYCHRTDSPLLCIKVYAIGGLRFLQQNGKESTYEAMLESILSQFSGKPAYVVILSAGNDVSRQALSYTLYFLPGGVGVRELLCFTQGRPGSVRQLSSAPSGDLP